MHTRQLGMRCSKDDVLTLSGIRSSSEGTDTYILSSSDAYRQDGKYGDLTR